MSDAQSAPARVAEVSDLSEHALALAAELRDRIARDRATAQALREYLAAAATDR